MRLIGKIVKWAGIGVLTLVVAGVLYQQIGLLLDAKFAPPPGDMVSVEGHAVHLVCMGQGSRTYVLDAGAGAGVFEWYRIQPQLAKTGRVCAFDRAGLGWSEAANGGYDGVPAAAYLALLVRAAKIPTPFIYVGHSLGANFAEIYQARYPNDVAALVLIEPGVPADLLEDFHGTRNEAMAAPDCDATCYAAGAATALGIVRLSAIGAGRRTLSEPTSRIYQAHLARPSTMMTVVASLNATPKTAYEDMDVRSFGKTPVLVIASSEPLAGGEFGSVPDYRKWRGAQLSYFSELAAHSAHGAGPLIVPNSTHASMTLGEAQANALTKMITEFVATGGR